MPLPRSAPLLAPLLSLLLPGAPATAHAILVDSAPAIGATTPPGKLAIRLRFNSRIDRARSRLTLRHPGAEPVMVLPIDATGPEDILTAAAAPDPGAWVLRWQVLAIDGHITRGDVAFTVAAPAAP